MVTGDNAQCGLYIAKECAMVAENVQVLWAEVNDEGRYGLVHQPKGEEEKETSSPKWRTVLKVGLTLVLVSSSSLNSFWCSLQWQPMATISSRSSQALSTTDMVRVHQKGLEAGLTELAVTGKAFNDLCRLGRMQELLLYTRIFSRFTPADKVQSLS